MAEISELMSAIDSFLAKKGKGDSYLVKKITALFEGEDAPLNTEKGALKEFKRKINNLNSNSEKLAEQTHQITKKIKTFNNVFSENFLKNLRGFRDNLKIPVLYNFFENLKKVNKGFTTNNQYQKKESAIKKNNIIDVRLKELHPTIEKTLIDKISSVISKKQNNSVVIQNNQQQSGLLTSILEGLIATAALFTGIGFIKKFLDESPIGKTIKNKLGDLKTEFVKIISPHIEKIKNLMLDGAKTVMVDLPLWFLKKTFNFFGLKKVLGEENEGIAVILTKGIYYGIKSFASKFINTLSLGSFNKITNSFKLLFGGISGLIGDKLTKIGSNLMDNISSPLKLLGSVPGMLGKFFQNLGFGSNGGLFKIISGMSKISSGTLFKLIGTGFKNIAKRIPIIGSLISFKDAYDRIQKGDVIGGLISIGSGIASIFPGVGTAISIGLDVLNAFLDYSDTGSSFKTDINNFITNAVDELMQGTMTFFSKILDWINPSSWGKDLWDWISGKKNEVISNLNTSPDNFIIPQKKSGGARTATPFLKTQQHEPIAPIKNTSEIYNKANKEELISLKDMNKKLEVLSNIFAEGVNIIASATVQGSNSVVQAVASTGGSKPPVIINSSDPIHDFRLRAKNAIEMIR